ncbi:TniB family NTP-binding protein [Rhizobium beringeri]
MAWIRSDRWLETAQARSALMRLRICCPILREIACLGLLLYGDAGMGKTKSIRKFLRDHAASFDRASGVTTMPVVAMQMHGGAGRTGHLRRTPECYGGRRSPRAMRLFRLKGICRSLMRSMGVRMLIIDEIHAMLTGTFRQQRIFLNVIRFLANDLRVPLVCAGTDLARQALLTDPQLAERFEAFHLERWSNDQNWRNSCRASLAFCRCASHRNWARLPSAGVFST